MSDWIEGQSAVVIDRRKEFVGQPGLHAILIGLAVQTAGVNEVLGDGRAGQSDEQGEEEKPETGKTRDHV